MTRHPCRSLRPPWQPRRHQALYQAVARSGRAALLLRLRPHLAVMRAQPRQPQVHPLLRVNLQPELPARRPRLLLAHLRLHASPALERLALPGLQHLVLQVVLLELRAKAHVRR